jgi:thioesterase domain-containing protein
LLDAQDKGRIQNVRSHSDDPRLSNLDEPVQSLTITTQDARALLEIASTVEDKDRHEHEALERVQQALEQHDRALEQTIEQRLDRGYGMGR